MGTIIYIFDIHVIGDQLYIYTIDYNIIVGTYYSLIHIQLYVYDCRVYDSAGGVRAACTHVWSIIISYHVSLFVLLRSSVVKPHCVYFKVCWL